MVEGTRETDVPAGRGEAAHRGAWRLMGHDVAWEVVHADGERSPELLGSFEYDAREAILEGIAADRRAGEFESYSGDGEVGTEAVNRGAWRIVAPGGSASADAERGAATLGRFVASALAERMAAAERDGDPHWEGADPVESIDRMGLDAGDPRDLVVELDDGRRYAISIVPRLGRCR